MTDIKYFKFGEEIYQLTPANMVGKEIIDTFGHLNLNHDDTITDQEVLEGYDESDKGIVYRELEKVASMFKELSKVPLRQLSYEQFENRMFRAQRARIKHVKNFGIRVASTSNEDLFSSDIDRQVSDVLNLSYGLMYDMKKSDLENVVDSNLNANFFMFTIIDPKDVIEYYHPDNGLPISITHFIDDNGEIVREIYYYNNEKSFAPFNLDFSQVALMGSLAFVDRYKQDLINSAEILSSHHPIISVDNALSTLATAFVTEMSNLQKEDVIQDMGACYDVDCEMMDNFENIFSDENKYINWIVWKTGSLYFGKDNQGYGPGQIILGLAKEAGGEKEILKKYVEKGYLNWSDFENDDSILRAIFSKKKFVYVKSLTLDYIFARIEETLLIPKVNFTSPIDWICPLTNDTAAAELMLLGLGRELMIQPEKSLNPQEIAPLFKGLGYYIGYQMWIGEFMNMPLKINGLDLKTKTSNLLIRHPKWLKALGCADQKNVEFIGNHVMLDCR